MTSTGAPVPATPGPSLRPGDPAPDFRLPALHRDGEVTLADYRGRTALLLALFRGIYCPFCRRAVTQLARAGPRLESLGVETLAVIATEPERARRYYRSRPVRLALAADPTLETHRAYRLPRFPVAGLEEAMHSVRINPTGELPEPLPIADVANLLDEREGFEWTPLDAEEAERQVGQLVGAFLIDREGLVRWADVEGAAAGLAGIGRFPSEEELLAAARTLDRPGPRG